MTQFPTTKSPIDIASSGPFLCLHQVRGITLSAQAFRSAEEFVTATAAMARTMWSEGKNDGHPLVINDVASAVGARLQMDSVHSTFPLYIDKTEFESDVRWQSDDVAKQAAAKIGLVRPVQQPKGPLAWLRSHFLRLY